MISVVSTLLPSLSSPRTLILTLIGGALAVLVAIGLIRYHVQGEELKAVQAERDALAADTARLRQSLRSIRAHVERRNDSLQALRKRADRLRRRVTAAGRRADSVRARSERASGRLMALPIPDGCHGAIRWGASMADSLATNWQ